MQQRYIRHLIITTFLFLIFLTPIASAESYTVNNRPDFIVFNVISNNPVYGNETNFLKIRDIKASKYSDNLNIKPGQEIVAQVYFDNDAAKASQVAKNSTLRLSISPKAGTKINIDGYIHADNTLVAVNANDSAVAIANMPVSLKYETGSAKLWNNVWRGKHIDDSIVSKGAKIGFAQLNGAVPGGPHFSGYVTLKFKVVAQVPVAAPVPGKTKQPLPSDITNTGPGDVIGIFAGSSALGAAYHIVRTARRNRR